MCGHDGRLQPLDDARPLVAALGLDAVLDAALEQHLHADADAQHRPAAGEPAADDPVALDRAQPAMQAANAPDARDDEPVGVQRRVEVGRSA